MTLTFLLTRILARLRQAFAACFLLLSGRLALESRQ